MGIRGLMTYVNRHSYFYDNYELHGGFLVIDGHSLASQLYKTSRCNCAFGGDHDVYARAVSDFFDDLLKCEVVPLVILDGGMEKKKMKTTYDRMVQKLQTAKCYTPATQERTKFISMVMTMIIFKTVLKQKGVKIARCVFEADPTIAGVAKVLNCPVLSYDSDFYIFGVKYIPIDTLEPFVVRKTGGSGYAKRCKLFNTDNFTRSFHGLDTSVLPLAAVLLGNDYSKSSVFKNFFACFKLSNQTPKDFNESQKRIHTILRWLRNYNLNDAVTAILSKLPKKRRRNILENIELVVNGYLILPCDILVSLGFADRYEQEMKNQCNRRPFKFQGNVDNLESRQLWREDRSMTIDNSDLDEKSEEGNIELFADDLDDVDEENFAKSWPSWFARAHGRADFPSYFIDMLSLRLFTTSTQIEDIQYPSAYSMSLKIVEVIDGLLVAGRKGVVPGLMYIIRDGTELTRRHFDSPLCGTRRIKFPPLDQLRETPMSIRKKIIDDTLMIDDKEDLFKDIPPQWQLYIATIVYWMKSNDVPLRNFCHSDALLIAMLLGVIDRKIGYHRNFFSFNRAHSATVQKIELQRSSKQEKLDIAKTSSSVVGKPQVGMKLSTMSGKSEIEGSLPSKLEKPIQGRSFFAEFETPDDGREHSIMEALEAVKVNDCLIAASFFIPNYIMDKQLVASPRKFNVTTVHIFAQFQSCLKHAIDLNVLLDCPYECPIIADMYNGTMLYNLYENFKTRNDPRVYIADKLKNAPTLLYLIKLLMWKVKCILDDISVEVSRREGTVRRRKKKTKKKLSLDDDNAVSEFETDMEVEITTFVDPQNPFTVLNSTL